MILLDFVNPILTESIGSMMKWWQVMEDVRQVSESGQNFETYRDSRQPLDEKQQGGDQFIINTRRWRDSRSWRDYVIITSRHYQILSFNLRFFCSIRVGIVEDYHLTTITWDTIIRRLRQGRMKDRRMNLETLSSATRYFKFVVSPIETWESCHLRELMGWMIYPLYNKFLYKKSIIKLVRLCVSVSSVIAPLHAMSGRSQKSFRLVVAIT